MLDLSDIVTVFVSTVGRDTYPECLDHLEEQDCTFRGPVVTANVAPMNVAFQRMLDSCQTPMFIQVDEDMLLHKHAVSSMAGRLSVSSSDVAIAAFPLWDTHLDRAIMGVKAYRHAIVRGYPFQDSASCEMDQAQRFMRDGFKLDTVWPMSDGQMNRDSQYDPLVMGEHVVRGQEVVYERYYNLGSKFARYGWMGWLGEEMHRVVQRLFERCQVHDPLRPSYSREEDLLALMGFAAGIAKPQEGEKNFAAFYQTPALYHIAHIVSGEYKTPSDPLLPVGKIAPEPCSSR